MKKLEFFTPQFLSQVDTELGRLVAVIEAQQYMIHPSALNDEELKVMKIFANRLLTILYHGHRITQKEWLSMLYLVNVTEVSEAPSK